MRLERVAIGLVPAVALATVGLGLRAGASSRTMGARVYASSPGLGRPGLALKLVTLVEEGGVVEVAQVGRIAVVASTAGGGARWEGASNSEGVAEAWLALDDLHAGDRVDLTVTNDQQGLAVGTIEVPAPASAAAADSGIRPQRSSGELLVDIFIYGGALVPNAPATVVAQVRDKETGRPLGGVAIDAEPEPGLSIDHPFPVTGERGMSVAGVTAGFLTAAWSLKATSTGTPRRTAEWSGALPVSAGAATVDLPPILPPGAPRTLELTVPPASPRLYLEVRDVVGRDFGAALDIDRASGGHANAVLPPLAAGVYWLVTSLDAHGGESMTGTTVARPFHVEASGGDAEREIADLARLATPNPPQMLILDGFAAPHRRAAGTRRRAMTIALSALAVATILEALLVLGAARRTQRSMRHVANAAAGAGGLIDGEADRVSAAARVLVLVLVTLLGFAVVALLLLDRVG
jgi:hypothetical protein